MATILETLNYDGYDFLLYSDLSVDIRWMSGASTSMNAETLWANFKLSTVFLSSVNYGSFSTVSKADRIYGSGGADIITKSTGGDITAGGGADTINAFSTGGASQQHVWGGAGNDTINLNFANVSASRSSGHHVRGDDDGSLSQGSDTFNFASTSSVSTGKTVMGRIEDFDASRDTIKVDGVTLNLSALPSYAKIVLHNGDHNDVGAEPQQWLVITTPTGGHIVYALEGARADMNGDGIPGGTQEHHFIFDSVVTGPGGHGNTVADIIALSISQPNVAYIDPQNVVPSGFTAQGGVTINDYDEDSGDVLIAINGGASGDLIAAGLNNDTVNGGTGNDRIWGGSGHDVINGDDGNDTMSGGSGNDSVNGGANDDTFNYTSGSDTIVGGSGIDTLVFAGSSSITISLFHNTNNQGLTVSGVENITTGSGADSVIGSAGNNILLGNDGNDTLSGYGGDDSLVGGNGDDSHWGIAGNDTIVAGAGNDTLNGGDDVDVMTGGAGNDIFQYFNPTQGGDFITDFGATASGNNDIFMFQASVFGGGLSVGALAASQFLLRANANTAADSNDRFIFNTANNTLWFDVDGTGAAGPVLIGTLQASVADLTAADIWMF